MPTAVRLDQERQSLTLPERPAFSGNRVWILLALLLLVTLLVYLPVHHHPYVNIDDNGYVSDNAHIKNGLNVATARWALTSYYANNWHPLTWMAHALAVQWFGLGPAGHHDVNLFLHLLDVALLFWMLWNATGYPGRSLMVAALFALHPLNVESVAWIAELKTMLSMFFFVLGLAVYRWYARQPNVWRYACVALAFVGGLASKPQVITFPAVLLLWDYWPLGRLRFGGQQAACEVNAEIKPRKLWWLLLEKAPLLVICLVDAYITMKAQQVGHPEKWPYTFPVRLENAIVSYARYVQNMFWPAGLAPMYLHRGDLIPLWQVGLALLFLLAVTALVIVQWRRRYLAVGWLWYLGTMVPMIGLMQVGRQALADRYAYLPLVGLFVMVCWGAADWASERRLPAAVLPGVSVAVLMALAALTYRQVGFWGDNVTLWAHTVQVTHDNFVAEFELAGALGGSGRSSEIVPHLYAAWAIAPDNPDINFALAVNEHQRGHLQAAIEPYKRFLAVADDPEKRYHAMVNLGHVYRRLGDTEQAQQYFDDAAKIAPKK